MINRKNDDFHNMHKYVVSCPNCLKDLKWYLPAAASRRDRGGLNEDLTSNLDIPLPITWMPCVTMHWYQPLWVDGATVGSRRST